MKKRFVLLVACILAFSLTACGKSEAAKSVDEQIVAIGEVTLDSAQAISDAEQAVATLEEKDKKQLEHVQKLEEARNTYEALVLKGKAEEIEKTIDAIGTVTLESGAAIDAAKSAYESATPEVKGLVGNVSVLDTAKEKLADLQVQQVVDQINAIGTVTLNSGANIEAAKKALSDLSAENQGKVKNRNQLDAAAEQIKALKRKHAESLLSKMRWQKDDVNNVSFYYPKGWKFYSGGKWVADVRKFVLPYIGKNSNNVWMNLVANYTGDDWVFFTKIIFSVDGQNYTETFKYWDVTRDNGGGDVWEYVDMDVSDYQIKMLKAIANSKKTIVRFEEDKHYDDFVMSAADKQAIREAVDAYEAWNQ